MERREAPGAGEAPHDEPLREVRPRTLTKRVANPSREARAFCNGEVCEAFRPNAAPPGAPPATPPTCGWRLRLPPPPRHERGGSESAHRIIFLIKESQASPGTSATTAVMAGLGPAIHVFNPSSSLRVQRSNPRLKMDCFVATLLAMTTRPQEPGPVMTKAVRPASSPPAP